MESNPWGGCGVGYLGVRQVSSLIAVIVFRNSLETPEASSLAKILYYMILLYVYSNILI